MYLYLTRNHSGNISLCYSHLSHCTDLNKVLSCRALDELLLTIRRVFATGSVVAMKRFVSFDPQVLDERQQSHLDECFYEDLWQQ